MSSLFRGLGLENYFWRRSGRAADDTKVPAPHRLHASDWFTSLLYLKRMRFSTEQPTPLDHSSTLKSSTGWEMETLATVLRQYRCAIVLMSNS